MVMLDNLSSYCDENRWVSVVFLYIFEYMKRYGLSHSDKTPLHLFSVQRKISVYDL